MYIPPTSNGGVYTAAPINWSFTCSYNTQYDVITDEISMSAIPMSGAFSAQGQFDLKMRHVIKINIARKCL